MPTPGLCLAQLPRCRDIVGVWNIGLQHPCAVTGLAHRGDQVVVCHMRARRFDRRLFGGEAYMGGRHARHFREGRFDARHAARAVHSFNIEFDAAHGTGIIATAYPQGFPAAI
jgi:hypothetical protein